jgi:hypothetical protein
VVSAKSQFLQAFDMQRFPDFRQKKSRTEKPG